MHIRCFKWISISYETLNFYTDYLGGKDTCVFNCDGQNGDSSGASNSIEVEYNVVSYSAIRNVKALSIKCSVSIFSVAILNSC